MSKRKASYDLTFKLKAVKCVEEKTKEAAAREFNVDPREQHNVWTWGLHHSKAYLPEMVPGSLKVVYSFGVVL